MARKQPSRRAPAPPPDSRAPLPLEEATAQALYATRRLLSRAQGAETDVLEAFANEFGAELAGWECRLQELRGSAR